jgi:membrane fusion protein (multidrug efflux system)
MLNLEDQRAEARSAAEAAQFEPGADRGAWPDAAAPKVLERWPRQDPDIETHEPGADELSHKGRNRRRLVVFALTTVCLPLVAAGGYFYWDNSGHFESTDDAYIASRQFAIAPEVSGYITAVPVTDNEHVATGQIIARIDDRIYRAALAQAVAQVVAARANINTVDAQMTVQQAQITADRAQLAQQQAALVFAQQQAVRYQDLAQTQLAGTVQNAQKYTSQLNQQQATVESAQATLKLAQRQVEALKAQRDSAVASLAQAKAQREQAQLNLSYTIVTADQPGRVVQLSAAVGQYAQPGANLSMFVPDDIWIWANFKETQLDLMRPGEPVTIAIF